MRADTAPVTPGAGRRLTGMNPGDALDPMGLATVLVAYAVMMGLWLTLAVRTNRTK